jgi:hypothetical protein
MKWVHSNGKLDLARRAGMLSDLKDFLEEQARQLVHFLIREHARVLVRDDC